MSSQQLQFYEQKIISDKEFPIEVFMNQVQDKSDQVYLSTRRSCCH